MEKKPSNIMELEHTIGYSGKIVRSVLLHPNGLDFICISGGSLIISSLKDPHEQYFLQEHDDQITCVDISKDGRLLASGQRGDNADVIIWDFSNKRLLFRLCEHDYEIACVSFSDDSRLLFSCGNPMDKKIFIWDTSNGFIVGSCSLYPDPLNCMQWGGFVKDIKGRDTNRYQFATAGNKFIVLWKFDAKAGSFEYETINTGSTIRNYLCMNFSKPKEEFLIAGTSSGDFCIFQIKNKLLSSITVAAPLGVTALVCPEDFSLIIGCGNGMLAKYQLDGCKPKIHSKCELFGSINSLSHNESLTLAATDRGFVYRVKSQDLQKALQCENHTESVVFVAYPPNVSDRFASCSMDGMIRVWDVNEYEVLQRISLQGAGYPLCLTYNSEVILSGWIDGKIRLFDMETAGLIWQIDNAHKNGVSSIVLSKNLKFLGSGGNESGEVRIWEIKSREMISHLKEHSAHVTKVDLIQDDTNMLSSSRDRALLRWDLKTEKRISAHYQRMGGINSFATVPESTIVLTTGQDRKITYWDLREPNPLRSIDTSLELKKGDECFDIAVSHNGKNIATGGSNQVVKLWDLGSGKLLDQGYGHSGCIKCVQFSYDDKQVVSAGLDGNLMLWNIYL